MEPLDVENKILTYSNLHAIKEKEQGREILSIYGAFV
jgi:hypothetical protein